MGDHAIAAGGGQALQPEAVKYALSRLASLVVQPAERDVAAKKVNGWVNGSAQESPVPHGSPVPSGYSASINAGETDATKRALSELDAHVTRINDDLKDIFSVLKGEEKKRAIQYLFKEERSEQPLEGDMDPEEAKVLLRSPVFTSHPEALSTHGPRHSIDHSIKKVLHKHDRSVSPGPQVSPVPSSKSKSGTYRNTTFSRSQQMKSASPPGRSISPEKSVDRKEAWRAPGPSAAVSVSSASIGAKKMTVDDWKRLRAEKTKEHRAGQTTRNAASHSGHEHAHRNDEARHCARCVPQSGIVGSMNGEGSGRIGDKKISKEEFQYFLDRKHRRKNAVEKWRADKKEEQERAEVAGLTFKPKINSKSKQMAQGIAPLHERMDRWKETSERKRQVMKESLEKQQEREMSHQPAINQKSKMMDRTLEHMDKWLAKRKANLASLQVEANTTEAARAPFKPQLSQRSLALAEAKKKREASNHIHAEILSPPPASPMRNDPIRSIKKSKEPPVPKRPRPVYHHYDDSSAREMAEKRMVLYKSADKNQPKTQDPLVKLISKLDDEDLTKYTQLLRKQYEATAAEALARTQEVQREASTQNLHQTALDILDKATASSSISNAADAPQGVSGYVENSGHRSARFNSVVVPESES